MIYINDIPSFRNPEQRGGTFDDRRQRIQLINGNVYNHNGGHVPSGDTFKLTCIFSKANYDLIVALWEQDATVTYTDVAGITHNNLKLKFNEYRYVDNFENYVQLSFELWRVPQQ